ncbi:OPT oligopeptide transporter protein [Pseudobythopirellula maris]|uniref:OPT oligopeptide transporter protein n=1 Tax=Pseudobythopirellula maris TaxID=2527991 RepID=A0A5C5ZSS1_9BACT|nr:oligopeptide transporter, OPT family [Pseudobythopirellula maris]TWT90300.1 OPT oligopeptide transporter protein [Pseudobythopirellula maris]
MPPTTPTTAAPRIPAAPYREVTLAAVVTGLLIGVGMTATFTYAGMTLGFSTSGSTVAAILGWGVLRGMLRRGTIVENNIVQTIASSLNTTAGGVVFTVPVLFLLPDTQFDFWQAAGASVAGALLGVGFVIPIRKQMIEVERLLFPSGTAVAAILRSPAEGLGKSRLLLVGATVSALFFFLKNTDRFEGIETSLPKSIDLGQWLGLPPYVQASASLSMFALGIGFIAGRNGLFVLAGSVVSYWVITPLVVAWGWGPAGGEYDPQAVGGAIHSALTRPLGIGMLLGGALSGVFLMAPAIRAALTTLRAASQRNAGSTPSAGRDEMPIGVLYASVALAVVTLFTITVAGLGFETDPVGSIVRGLLVAVVGSLWVWFSSIVIAQATGMTDWTPLSGMALLAVVILMYLTGGAVAPTVMLGAAVSVACSLSADMMQDLKTGQLVGSRPARQQFVQLACCGLGPIIALSVIALLWQSGPNGANGFGPGTAIAVPQADALRAVIEQVQGGSIDWTRYGAGALVGAVLSLSGLPGLGVIVGISMYLGISIVLPYGLGAIARELLALLRGADWCESTGTPLAVGLIVGDGLTTLLFASLTVLGALR